MISFSAICAIFAALIAISNSSYYLVKTLKREISPHCFTWLVWGTLMVISGAAMLSAKAGLAAFVVGIHGILCLIIGIVSIFYGHKEITYKDKTSFLLAILAIALWQVTNNPLAAILLTTSADLLRYYPTFRKSYNDPFNESLQAFGIYIVADALIVLSIEQYSLATALYPSSILAANLFLTLFILIRRKQLKNE